MKLDLTGKAVLVTGGSRGIGRAIAQALASCGARVAVNYKSNLGAAEEVLAAIRGTGGEALGVQGDVGQSAEAEKLIAATTDAFGRIDVLVNNAGVTRDTLLLRMKDADFDQVLDTNLRSVYLCTRAALKPMLKQRGGSIINMTSVVGLVGNAGQANYAAAKAGIIGFTKSVAKEVASRGIRVNAVAPGFITTDLTSSLGGETLNAIAQSIPLGRLGTPEDVAGIVCFLASDLASYCTGQTFTVDGGMTMV
jgi:3-oxoacyl-[acyl-carrier protein] reductase